MLEVRDLHAAYEGKEALHGLSFEVAQGACVCLIGANGAGKTTAMRCLSGLLRPTRGTITFAGRDITKLPPAARVAAGITLVPEGRRVFAPMTVRENLEMGAYRRRLAPRDRPRGACVFRRRVRSVPAAARTHRPVGRRAVGWRAANARHRAGADVAAQAF